MPPAPWRYALLPTHFLTHLRLSSSPVLGRFYYLKNLHLPLAKLPKQEELTWGAFARPNSIAEPPSQNQLQTASQVEKTAKSFLESCPTDRYLVVLQPGLSADDLRAGNGRAVPNLQRALSHESATTAWSVSGVAGEVSVDEITDFINDACAKVDKVHLVEEMALPALPARNGASKLSENGSYIRIKSQIFILS